MRNYHAQTACATGVLTLAMAMPVLADSNDQVTRQMLSEADRIAIFGKDSNFQVALLTDEEMAETKGAHLIFAPTWIARMRWGTYFGIAHYGYNMITRPYEYGSLGWGHAMLAGQFMLMDAIVGLIGRDYRVATLAGFGSLVIHDQEIPMNLTTRVQELFRENDWTVPEVLISIGNAMDEIARGFIDPEMQGDGGGAEPESMSMASSSGSRSSRVTDTNYLVNLLGTLDRASMRQFFSSLPERTLRLKLAQVNIEFGTAKGRDDFLANLPNDVVNSVLLELSNSDMQRFLTEVVPQNLQDTIASIPTTLPSGSPSGPTTTLSVHWIY